MEIELNQIKVSDLFEGYEDNGEEGVVGYGGRLNIRPSYQREFVYKDAQRNAVLHTVRNGFPLNVMYWVKTGEDTYEVLDGQQRTLSLCKFLNGDYSIDFQYRHNLPEDELQQILDYELTVYICEGTESEKLDWFKTVNIAGEKLTDQELRNAVYAGPWLEDAKRYFSRSTAPAKEMSEGYMSGSPLRQDYLETVLEWKSDGNIEDYMSQHQADRNANELWLYFRNVIAWAQTLFPNERREMKNVKWGELYNTYHTNDYDADEFEETIRQLMMDDDVTKKSGIYRYLFDGREKHLNIRAFTPAMRRAAYERQEGICASCEESFSFSEMEADHITPWHDGGKTKPENCEMLCKACNREKAGN